MKSQMWLLDPRPNLPYIVDMVEQGFELSEASNTPVMLELRIRACHVHRQLRDEGQRAPALAPQPHPERRSSASSAFPCRPPTTRRKSTRSMCACRRRSKFIQREQLNELFAGDLDARSASILQGGMYNTTIRALQQSRPGGCLRRIAHPAVRAQRHLSADARGDHALLLGQARRAGGGGGPARPPRGGHQLDPAPRRHQRPARHRQGRAADGWRVHRRSAAERARRLPGADFARRRQPQGRRSGARVRRAGENAAPPNCSARRCRRVRPASASAARSGRCSPR